jgi:ABC-type lipoprotein export system ATPase subunit
MRLAAKAIALKVGSRELFDDLTFSVESGHSLAIVGPSGVGKSSLLSAIAGYSPLSKGSIEFEGLRGPPSIQWLMQSTPLLTNRSALDNVTITARLRGVDEQGATAQAIQVMESLGLRDRVYERVFGLSGGERQRVAIARTILARANIVLADEPTASLDPNSRDGVSRALRSIAESGAVVVVATHDVAVAGSCDQTINLVGGR